MTLDKEYLITEMNKIVDKLIIKNTDYGDSFFKLMDKWGFPAFFIRLSDKTGRLESLYENKKTLVKDETFIDTVDDIIGYCLLFKYYNDKWEN